MMEKLKRKVASSSSRVIASLQQAASSAGTSQPPAVSRPPEVGRPAEAAGAPGGSSSLAARLMATDATAHLTEQERRILLEVFKKEEQFQRDTIIQMTASRGRQNQLGAHNVQPPSADSSHRYKSDSEPRKSNSKNVRPQRQTLANRASSRQSSPSSSLVSGYSTTPVSRPGSSVFGTPTAGLQLLSEASQLRTGSSCSNATIASGQVEALGQCRICRKSILVNEKCHLCSSCKQFICEDCASYSAVEQHWMCSSCKRRATKPAIPADALKELGLNQNSSALRRMTLRLNQVDELKHAFVKAPTESNTSSNSSSGCSSDPIKTEPGHHRLGPSCREEPKRSPQGRSQARALPMEKTSNSRPGSSGTLNNPEARGRPTKQQQQQQCDMRTPDQPGGQNLASGESRNRRAAQKTLSQPIGHHQDPSGVSGGLQSAPSQSRAAAKTDNGQSKISQVQYEKQQRARRASMTTTEGLIKSKKQPATLVTYQNSFESDLALADSKRAYFDWAQNKQAPSYPSGHFENPQTMITASSDQSMGDNPVEALRYQQLSRNSIISHHQHPIGTTLISIPPDQIHLRRLSDQSNLVRRSSIIADTIDASMIARNRSHSNIDTVSYLYQSGYQHPLNTSCEPPYDLQQQAHSLGVSQNYASQQRRPSDQWADQQLIKAQQENYTSQEYQQNANEQQISSIITSYTQKHHHSSEEIHSDSSSDIEEDIRVAQATYELDNEQPNEYFAPPRALSSFLDTNETNNQAPVITIPSVSVSEFRPSHQRLNQAGQDIHDQKQQITNDQIMTTPMQINVAIEQVIHQQQRQQQHRQSLLPSDSELFPTQGYLLLPRRGSSGRVLPKIPNEQSRSLLELPYNTTESNGSSSDPSFNMLDLPGMSATIRRASAPEGQNIKIVVDDIDNSMLGVSLSKQSRTGFVKQGELYERLVLYRDDTLDPNTNLAKGFGLHVMGGKIDDNDQLEALVTWTLPGGPADKVGLKRGDRIIEWDGKYLVNMSYEQVTEVIESSANIAELLVKPAHKIEPQPGANYVRSQRRLSQQTERDLKKVVQPFSSFGPVSALQQASRDGYNDRNQSNTDNNRTSQYTGGSYSRAGTGRRLPRIPGLSKAEETLEFNNVQYQSILPQTEYSIVHKQFSNINLNHLSALQGLQQQSVSAGELYSGQPYLAHLGSQTNASQFYTTQWQSQVMLDNGYSKTGHNGQVNMANQDQIYGLIGLQVNVDERVSQLEISVLSAININLNPTYDYYVRVKILPENNRFKPCTTQPSSELSWKETFIFQNFPVQSIQRMALEIGIWVYDDAPRLSTQMAQPLCETLIPIQSARERNTDFWPLRPPPTSPQARRRSLNDLIETNKMEISSHGLNFSYGYPHNVEHNLRNNKPIEQHPQSLMRGSQKIQPYDGKDQSDIFMRERSSSSRNLPDMNKLSIQPRRASDEVASSSRLVAKVSPGASRRSISVMNVGDGQGRSSRKGSQSNMKTPLRRDSNQQLHQQQQQQQPISVSASPPKYTSTSNANARAPEPEPMGVTPSGRRSSLVGLQSMAGYRSQKNSQSDTTDPDPAKGQKKTNSGTPTKTSLYHTGESKRSQQHRASIVSNTSTQASAEESSSRRGSGGYHGQLQRKGSLAMMTLRKLKRTMSLTKGNELESGSKNESRRSSESSEVSSTEIVEDLGVSKRIVVNSNRVGKVKLSFIMTKGQLEVDVICAEGLKFDHDSALGFYVKIYLKGKNRSNKRKTRVIQPCESPDFKQLIKYDGSLVDNKSLEVSVWQTLGGLKGKIPIGFTEIQLNELNLEQLQTSWYNLHPRGIICGSSVED